MANFWEIKRYGDDSILVSEKVAAGVAQAKATGKESVIIKKDGKDMLIDCKAISAVEESKTRIPDENPYLLGDGKDGSEKPTPILNMEGAVVTNWYKKPVNIKQWEGYYSKMGSYYMLSSQGGTIWLAWRKPEMYNDMSPLGDGVEKCTDEESNRLWDAHERRHDG